jgi:hypothetical protein
MQTAPTNVRIDRRVRFEGETRSSVLTDRPSRMVPRKSNLARGLQALAGRSCIESEGTLAVTGDVGVLPLRQFTRRMHTHHEPRL